MTERERLMRLSLREVLAELYRRSPSLASGIERDISLYLYEFFAAHMEITNETNSTFLMRSSLGCSD